MKKAIFLFIALSLILVLSLNLISAVSYYGGYLGEAPEQEYTTYHIIKNTPWGYYDKTYTKTSYQTPGGEVTTKTYTTQDNNAFGYGYNTPSTTYIKYASTKVKGLAYTDYYPALERSCPYWRCQPTFADNKKYYSNDYSQLYYYYPYYDSFSQHYVWEW